MEKPRLEKFGKV